MAGQDLRGQGERAENAGVRVVEAGEPRLLEEGQLVHRIPFHHHQLRPSGFCMVLGPNLSTSSVTARVCKGAGLQATTWHWILSALSASRPYRGRCCYFILCTRNHVLEIPVNLSRVRSQNWASSLRSLLLRPGLCSPEPQIAGLNLKISPDSSLSPFVFSSITSQLLLPHPVGQFK